ncbi:MAG: RtcB family protein [Bacteroidetes bacterium]|jgi:tRNA-splicing ligase RtcB (3'-phosphate/5'-hydroxy nucleic acid ligase)|nr:RtcB family protein [Bacteroidota bacterium]MBT6685508.1 RtcB family protein [Bacteroidota bacterium]MBT7144366.1 RtcB family protein [Bacteroidota bacterium]MBT7491794.1 RtcB family protein [Bacteroidota bacterium]
MEKVLKTESGLIKMWLGQVEESAMRQAEKIANLPFTFKHVALMPDCHTGYGMPIGGVLATKGVVIPNAVGVDIGCGMCAIKTSLNEIQTNNLKSILDKIRKRIPVGFDWHKEKQDEALLPQCQEFPEFVKSQYQRASYQIGTLGGGNHFIEIQKGDDGHIWIMVHSGSRNLGAKVAEHYNKIAVRMNDLWFSEVQKKWELAFLPIESKEAKSYFEEMNYCVDFAFANRKLMMDRIVEVFFDTFRGKVEFEPMINIAHNYARWENHFNKNVIVHRKGATSARKAEIGIIPGSQGSKSYIVEGLGNSESFESCSHGAGRLMGRKQAQRQLKLENEIEKLNKQGIIHSIKTTKDLDEASGAYKNISEVMNFQKDLVKVKLALKPLAVIKG